MPLRFCCLSLNVLAPCNHITWNGILGGEQRLSVPVFLFCPVFSTSNFTSLSPLTRRNWWLNRLNGKGGMREGLGFTTHLMRTGEAHRHEIVMGLALTLWLPRFWISTAHLHYAHFDVIGANLISATDLFLSCFVFNQFQINSSRTCFQCRHVGEKLLRPCQIWHQQII